MTSRLKYEDIPLLVISIFAVMANTFVCILVLVTRRLRTHTNRFVVSLAISDNLIAGILLPCFLANVTSTVTDYMGSMTLLAGVANISVVTIDRYIAVFKPFRYNEIMRSWFTKIIGLTWTLSIAISLVPLIWGTNHDSTAHRVYIFTVQIGLVMLAYALIFIAYYKIFRKVRQTVRKERTLMMSLSRGQDNAVCSSSSESKVTRISIIIALNFMLTWFPVEYMTLVYNMGREDLIPEALYTISLYTIALGALIDPMVYSYLKSDFRLAIKRACRKYRSQDNDMSTTHSIMGHKHKDSAHQSTEIRLQIEPHIDVL